MSRHEAWGLWEGGVGWGSPSSGARVKKQGKAGWAWGWRDGAEEDSERRECPLQMPSLYDLHHITYTYGVPMVYLNARECQ